MDILRTYYYDYHCLKISIETNKLQIECDQLELDNAKLLGADCTLLENRVAARTAILVQQEKALEEMTKVIESFPKQFEGVEYKVFKRRYMRDQTALETATELGYSENYIYKISSRILDSFQEYLNKLNK